MGGFVIKAQLFMLLGPHLTSALHTIFLIQQLMNYTSVESVAVGALITNPASLARGKIPRATYLNPFGPEGPSGWEESETETLIEEQVV